MIIGDYFRKKNCFASCYSAMTLLEASVSMAGTMEAALLFVVDNRWKAVVHIRKEATGNIAASVCSCAKVAARETGRSCSTTPPPLLPMVAVGEAHPEHDGPAHGIRVPRIRVRSVEWDILATAVLTCYYIALLRCRR